jgi:site-specific DNA-methyltransferase (adenine-specific)
MSETGIMTAMETDYIRHGDGLELLRELPDESVDILWTDPPYGMDLGNGTLHARRSAEVNVHRKDWKIENDDPGNWERVVRGMLTEAARVLKRDAILCCCCGGGGGPRVLFAQVAGWMDDALAFDQAVVWDKGRIGLGWRYRRTYDFVMVAHKKGGRLKWETKEKGNVTSNVVKIGRAVPKPGDHPTPKPVALVEHFLRLHGKPGDVVCDPFAGSGTTLVAAKRLGMRYVGCELDERWYELAVKRLREEPAPEEAKDAG